MGTVSVTGAIVIITGWFALVEFDHFSETERKKILQKIKRSPALIMVISFMPLGILINLIGTAIGLLSMIMIGATLIFLQGIIVSLLFWKRKRWKSILLLAVIVILGSFMYIPLFI
ncbi:hypothetical protein ACFPTR_08380 [Aliibacillus thermotolerans]|uniref:Uncharacterized protein n=1 Tax=Aliibacillus thermotolerans TaxID=1834418 RepID=A0ABW0U660_9BACI|nr:hypothetical protein [Aliibacillus thermotolerans]MDA3130281.1 hypothetical protein [Aliibacillus thermotolerans]